jgi:hypothetical protein
VTKNVLGSQTSRGLIGWFMTDIGHGLTPAAAYTDTTGKAAMFD